MLKRFRCWLYGHDFMQKGFNRIRHTTYSKKEIIESVLKDHYLFICRCCGEFKEYECSNSYFDVSENDPVFAEMCEEEES